MKNSAQDVGLDVSDDSDERTTPAYSQPSQDANEAQRTGRPDLQFGVNNGVMGV